MSKDEVKKEENKVSWFRKLMGMIGKSLMSAVNIFMGNGATLHMDSTALADVEKLMKKRNISASQVIREAISSYSYIDEAIVDKHKFILMVNPDIYADLAAIFGRDISELILEREGSSPKDNNIANRFSIPLYRGNSMTPSMATDTSIRLPGYTPELSVGLNIILNEIFKPLHKQLLSIEQFCVNASSELVDANPPKFMLTEALDTFLSLTGKIYAKKLPTLFTHRYKASIASYRFPINQRYIVDCIERMVANTEGSIATRNMIDKGIPDARPSAEKGREIITNAFKAAEAKFEEIKEEDIKDEK